MPLSDYFARYLPAIDAEMRRVVSGPPSDHALTVFYGMLHYHLGWVDVDFKPATFDAGKRLRPVMTLLTCEAAGGDWESALPAAAAIELLHNFSLIHDDIEDGDPTRRGRPTLWTIWGRAQAINAGDALFTLAHLALGGMQRRNVPPTRQLQVRERFNQACLVLTQGQHLDLSFESRPSVSEAEYVYMIGGKTAELVATACAIGAMVAGSEATQCYEDFGREVGFAFQIEDDLLGIWGDPRMTGKPAGNDIINRKKSLPVAYGLERSERLRDLYAATDIDVAAVVAELDRCGARRYSEALAAQHHQRALSALDAATYDNEATSILRELANSLLHRAA
ncbi:MAG: polyprenyl synthetase family protein [Anaerolineae bacterium]